METRFEVLKSTDVQISRSLMTFLKINLRLIFWFLSQNSNWFLQVSELFNDQVLLFFIYVFYNGEYILDNISRN